MNDTGRGNIPDGEKQVVVFDINPEMLEVGRLRAPRQLPNKSDIVGFVEGNAEALPFPDNSFDVYTIAFGLRNVTNREVSI
jgi:ubiquinone/menaquinone biosynthesis C-methylase UbiE